MKYCPFCAEKFLDNNLDICPFCGCHLEKTNIYQCLTIILLIITILFCIYFFIYLWAVAFIF